MTTGPRILLMLGTGVGIGVALTTLAVATLWSWAQSETPGHQGAVAKEEAGDGFWIQDAKMNDVVQYLAQQAELQYFHNPELNDRDFLMTSYVKGDVTGIPAVKRVVYPYGLIAMLKDETIYVLTLEQWERVRKAERIAASPDTALP